jgi:hypothetical protein
MENKKYETFREWYKNERWSSNLLVAEFAKHDVPLTHTAVWHWLRGAFKPNQINQDTLSKIAGFDVSTFREFQKK